MGKDKDPLTPAEWKVMTIAWRLEEFAARDICQEARDEHGMSVSTVKTHLRRLTDKGYLSTKRVGNSFLYRAATRRLRTLKTAADGLLEKMVEGTTAPLLAYMLEKSRISKSELDELRALLESREPDREDE